MAALITRITCTADHWPPRGVISPRALSSAAICRSDAAQPARTSSITGKIPARPLLAIALHDCRPLAAISVADLGSGANGRVQRRAGGQADGLAARKRAWKIASSRKLISMRMATT